MASASVKPRRRLFRFSIRSLGAMMLVCAVALSWARQRYLRHDAAEQLKAIGVAIVVDPAPPWLSRILGERNSRFFEAVSEADLSVSADRSHFVGGAADAERLAVVLEPLSQQSRLRRLNLTSQIVLEDRHLAALSWLTRLEELQLDRTAVSDVCMRQIRRCRRLRKLSLYKTRIGDAGLAHLVRLRDLEELDLAGTEIRDPGLRHLRGLSKLRRLNLSETQIGDEGAAHLGGLSQLRALNLCGTKLSDAGLGRLAALRELEQLWLSETDVSDEGLAHLGQFEQLTTLSLAYTDVTDAGMDQLKSLPQLRTLHLYGAQVTDKGAERLQAGGRVEIHR